MDWLRKTFSSVKLSRSRSFVHRRGGSASKNEKQVARNGRKFDCSLIYRHGSLCKTKKQFQKGHTSEHNWQNCSWSPEVTTVFSEISPGLERTVSEFLEVRRRCIERRYCPGDEKNNTDLVGNSKPTAYRTASGPKYKKLGITTTSYELDIDLGSGEDLPESKPDVMAPTFTFSVLDEDMEEMLRTNVVEFSKGSKISQRDILFLKESIILFYLVDI